MAYFKSFINWYIPMAVFKKRCTKRTFFNLVIIDWARFSLASSSLQRVWCHALISGSRTAPCVSGKTNSRMTVPFTLSVSRFDQLLAYLLDFGPYSFVSLSQPVRYMSFQTQRDLAAHACLQGERSEAKVSHPLPSMPKAFRSLLQTTL